tara:strand:- start:2431 stop:3645 length:1215 start_codon:yes stop_codon:yes gene_type:complete
MAIPTLTMIPSGYKAGKLYSVLPTNGDGDFTTSRSSSATRVNKSGLIETVLSNVPRLDYSDGSCPSLLLEPQSTNLFTYSEEFNQGVWLKARSSVSNGVLSPKNSLDAYKFFDSTDNNSHLLYRGMSVVLGSVYSISCFIKKGTINKAFLAFNSNLSQSVVFDLENGTVISQGNQIDSSQIEEFKNGWYRCSFTHTATTTGNLFYRLGTYVSGLNYLGTGVDFINIFGMQLEQQSYPTSYISTNGSAVTRNADTCFGAGDSSTFNGSQGVIMVEMSALIDIGTKAIAITDGTANNIITIRYSNSQIQGIYVNSANSTTYQINYTASNVKDFTKVAFSYQSGSLKLYVNGTLIQNIALVVNDIPDWNTLQFNIGNGTQIFYGNTKQIQYFDTALTNAELQELTTI